MTIIEGRRCDLRQYHYDRWHIPMSDRDLNGTKHSQTEFLMTPYGVTQAEG